MMSRRHRPPSLEKLPARLQSPRCSARRDRSLRPRQNPPRLHPPPWNRNRERLAAVADVEVAGDRVHVRRLRAQSLRNHP